MFAEGDHYAVKLTLHNDDTSSLAFIHSSE